MGIVANDVFKRLEEVKIMDPFHLSGIMEIVRSLL
jgi:hypothetical protein